MILRRLTAILIVCWLLAATPAAADVASEHFNRGNRLYSEREYEQALLAYQAALDAGADDPDVYLNFGNAAFRLGETGLAVWACEMGLRLAPRDDDLRFNLRYAKAFMRDEMPPVDQVFILRVARAVALWMTAGEALLGAAVGWALFGLAFLLWGPWRRRHGLVLTIGILGLLLLVFFAPIAGWRLHVQLGVDKAVVTAEKTTVRTAPAPEADEAFTIHAGMPLVLVEQRDRYARIKIPSGMEGWLPRDAYRPIER